MTREYAWEILFSERKDLLFDLDSCDTDCQYAIDSTEYGNVSRFINHSCNPNLEVRAVYVDCIDAKLLFATRLIHPNEEITIDYLCKSFDKNDKREESPSVLCKYSSKNCLIYLY